MKKLKEVIKCPIRLMALILSIEAVLLFTGVNAFAAELPQVEELSQTEELPQTEELNLEKFTQPNAETTDIHAVPGVEVKTLTGPDGFWNKEHPENWVSYYTEQDVLDCAWVLWYEYGASKSFTEKSKVVWTICNRVDDSRWGNSFRAVVTEPGQFSWHGEPNTAKMSEEVITVARDVLERWSAEKNGIENVGRTLPKDSIGFYGDGQRNHFYAQTYGGPRHYYHFSPNEGPYDN